MVYEFKAGAHIKANAQVAGEMCEKLAAEGRLTAADLVEENRPETAPLHNAFEWNNEAAAENWRLHQARHIIGSLIVKREEKEPVRAYFKIERTDTKYTHINAILKSEADTELLRGVYLCFGVILLEGVEDGIGVFGFVRHGGESFQVML